MSSPSRFGRDEEYGDVHDIRDGTKYVAEFTGTFLLTLVVVLSGGSAISIAVVLMILIYALAGVSGGHLNPAVTFGILLLGKLPGGIKTALVYFTSQLLGALFGATMGNMLMTNGHDSAHIIPPEGQSWGYTCAAEIIYTAFLVFTVFNVACSTGNSGNQFYGVAIGCTIIAGGLSTGGCFNPAVVFGINSSRLFWNSDVNPTSTLLYIICQLLGTVCAWQDFTHIRPEDGNTYIKAITGRTMSKVYSEIMGTFYLVMTILFASHGAKPELAGFAIGASLTAGVYSLGSVSGANFNPAVTLTIIASGRNKMSITSLLPYLIGQFAGAFMAVAVAYFVMPGHYVHIGPINEHEIHAALTAEFIFTGLLMYTILCLATCPSGTPTELFAIAIGGCIVVAADGIGSISGAVLNPVVAISADVHKMMFEGFEGNFENFGQSGWYSIAEILGGIAAVCLFRITHAKEYTHTDGYNRF